jgi:hypothetical protein
MPGALQAVRSVVNLEHPDLSTNAQTMTLSSANEMEGLRRIISAVNDRFAFIVNHREMSRFFVAVSHNNYLAIIANSSQALSRIHDDMSLEGLTPEKLREALRGIELGMAHVFLNEKEGLAPNVVLMSLQDFSALRHERSALIRVTPSQWREILACAGCVSVPMSAAGIRTIPVGEIFVKGEFRNFIIEGHPLQLTDMDPLVLISRSNAPAALVVKANKLKSASLEELEEIYKSATGQPVFPELLKAIVSAYQAGDSSNMYRALPGGMWTSSGHKALLKAQQELTPIVVGPQPLGEFAAQQDWYIYLPVKLDGT